GGGIATVSFANQADIPAPGDLVINKTTTGGNGTFTFTVTGPNAYSSTQTVRTIEGAGTTKISGLPVGVYTVTENTPVGWVLNSINGQTASVTVSGIATVNFANQATNVPVPGDLVINKTTTGGNGTFTFTVTGPNAYSSTQTVRTIEGAGTTKISGLPVGVYTVTENTPAGWVLNSINGQTASVTVSGIATVNFANQ